MNKKSIILFLTMIILPLMSSAYDFKVDGIYYSITSKENSTVSVTSKGSYAFPSYRGAVVIPPSVIYNDSVYCVAEIGDHAFANCDSLVAVTIPNSVTLIGLGAFSNCRSLTSIAIPPNVESIGRRKLDFLGASGALFLTVPAFTGCSSLASIVVDGGNVTYDSRNNCNAIIETSSNTLIVGSASTIIPDNVTSIGDYAFSGRENLTSISIPEGVTEIGRDAFDGCSGLTSITVEDGNAKYDSRNNCNAIIETGNNMLVVGCSSTIIPESVIGIGEHAFYGCNTLLSIAIPKSVAFVEGDAFEGTGWYENLSDGGVYINDIFYKYKGDAPDNGTIIIRKGTKVIAPSALSSCNNLTSVVIPEGVVEIGRYAFSHNNALSSIEVPASITKIGEYAFSNCENLTTINIPKNSNLTSVGSSAFEGTAWYDRQVGGLIYVGNMLYEYKGEMPEGTAIVIKEGTTVINSGIFSGRSALISVTIPEGVTEIEESAFWGCNNLLSVTMPNSVTSIGKCAFMSCGSLKSINIPEGVEKIGDFAFSGCTNLPSITIPKSVISIGKYAFASCVNLSTVTIHEGVSEIGDGVFWKCFNLDSVSIPKSVVSMGNLGVRTVVK